MAPKDKRPDSIRKLRVRVKTAAKRSNSSSKWLDRQLNDPYVIMAKQAGYRSRAAYKILEINDKFNLFKLCFCSEVNVRQRNIVSEESL